MFSVIIPLYNKENSIVDTINSVLNQTFKDFEILIVDDGSTDSSLEHVRKAIKEDERIKLITKEHGGVSAARNEGINQACYDYIAFLDADDIWVCSYLEEQKKLIDNFPDAAMWGMNYSLVNKGKHTELNTGLPGNFRGYITDYFSTKHASDLFCSSSVVVHKKCFDKIGLFDTRIDYSEDLDMWYRIILNFPVAFDSTISVKYIQDTENRALSKHRPLRRFLPYFVSKYNEYCSVNLEFSYYIHTFAASNLIVYYFTSIKEHKDAEVAIKHLRYNDIHPKYRLFFKTPYLIGIFFYWLYSLKIRIWKHFGIRFRLIRQYYRLKNEDILASS